MDYHIAPIWLFLATFSSFLYSKLYLLKIRRSRRKLCLKLHFFVFFVLFCYDENIGSRSWTLITNPSHLVLILKLCRIRAALMSNLKRRLALSQASDDPLATKLRSNGSPPYLLGDPNLKRTLKNGMRCLLIVLLISNPQRILRPIQAVPKPHL